MRMCIKSSWCPKAASWQAEAGQANLRLQTGGHISNLHAALCVLCEFRWYQSSQSIYLPPFVSSHVSRFAMRNWQFRGFWMRRLHHDVWPDGCGPPTRSRAVQNKRTRLSEIGIRAQSLWAKAPPSQAHNRGPFPTFPLYSMILLCLALLWSVQYCTVFVLQEPE